MESVTGIKKFIRSKTFTLLILFVALVILFTILSGGSYLSVNNMTSILNGMVLVTFLTIGEAFLLIMGNLDLSAGYVGTMSAYIFCISITNWGFPWWGGLIMGVATGAICGLLNALMVCELNFQSFIATLAMSSIAQGLTYVISGGAAVPLQNNVWAFVGTKTIGGIVPVSVIIALLFLLVYGILLAKTKFGRTIYLCGGNPTAARLCGLNPKKYLYGMFINCGALASVAGIMFAARQKNITVNGISQNQFGGVTAAILGGISFGGGSGNMLGCFFGLCILNGFETGMTVLGANPYLKNVFNGALLIVALLFDVVSNKRAAKKQLAKTMQSN
jgi:ribose transport system permease protein